MSLIYNALNKLEKKIENGTPNMLGNLGADQYVLSSKSSGMPTWVKVLLVLSLLGVVSGWLATSVLKEQLQTLQDNLKSRDAKLPVQASASVTNDPVAVIHGVAMTPVVPVVEDLAQVDKQDDPLLANTGAKLNSDPNKADLRPTNLEKNANSQQEVAADEANVAAASAIPENEISHVEIRLESPIVDAVAPSQQSKLERKAGKQDSTTASAKLMKTGKVDKRSELNNTLSNDAVARAENMNVQEISRLTQTIKAAINAGKKAEADDMIAQLEKRLEPESLTLLHLKAWRQMQGGDLQQAINLYQQIVERNPEDETAAINLALSLWRNGQQTDARKVINAIAERRPDSEIVQSYSRQFGVQK